MIRRPGFVVTDHTLAVPLDHAAPHGPGRSSCSPASWSPRTGGRRPAVAALPAGWTRGEAPRPFHGSDWIDVALRADRVLLLDRRGVGRSNPLTPAVTPGRTDQKVADHLALHRAAAIVADCELLRRHLLGDRT